MVMVSLASQVAALSKCREFEDVHLRVNEKRVLNSLNKDKNRPSIRQVSVYIQLCGLNLSIAGFQ